MKLSIVVPTLREAEGIVTTLEALQPLRTGGDEVLVVDGGSEDGTVRLAAPLADRVIVSPPGRATQQNAGARAASGDVLLFLHADTRLPARASAIVRGALAEGWGWGRFDLRLTGRHPTLRVVERMVSLRSRVTGIATGDQAIWVRRDWFDGAGGFPEIPLMEDVELTRALKRRGRPRCHREPVTTSSRRWETRGVHRTILLMWSLRLRFALGADPAELAARYR